MTAKYRLQIVFLLFLAAAITGGADAVLTDDDLFLYVFNSTGNNTTTAFNRAINGITSSNLTIEGSPQYGSYGGMGFNTTNNNATIRIYQTFGNEWKIGNNRTNFSVYGWIVPSIGSTNQGTIWSSSFNSTENVTTCQYNVGGAGIVSCAIFDGFTYRSPQSGTMPNNGLPSSFVYIGNITQSRLWINGVLQSGVFAPQTGSAQRSYVGQRTDFAAPFNGTILWLGANTRTITTAEIEEVTNLGWNYLNQTPYEIYVNITVSGSNYRTLPANLRGAHTAEAVQNPAYDGAVLRNHTQDLLMIDTMRIRAYRKDYDFANFCPTYSGNPTLPCTFTTSFGNNYNITSVQNMVTEAAARGIKVHFVGDGPTRWSATNLSNCNYGTNVAPDFDYTSCDWHNNTIQANAINQFLTRVGCGTYPGTCVHEGRNEPYLSNGNTLAGARGVFYFRNSTVTCEQRRAAQMIEWNQTFPLVKAFWNKTVEYWSPAMNYGFHVCGPVIGNSFMTNFPAGGANSPDYMNTHEYSSSDPPVLNSDLLLAQNAMTAGGYGSIWGITETNLNSNALNINSQVTQAPALLSSFMYLLQNTSAQRFLLFQYDGDETYTIYNHLNNTVRFPGLMLNATKWIDETAGNTVRTCTTTNINVTCAYVLRNNTAGFLMISNRNNRTVLVQTVNASGANITSAVSNTDGTVITSVGGLLIDIPEGRFGFDGWNLTLNAGDTLPPTLNNRSEFSNQTLLQINVTCSEACNASMNFGTDYTVLGNVSNITGYSLTNRSFNITPLFSATLYHYNITVCDSVGNCATYGIFSEPTKSFNISYLSTTPANVVNITEPSSQVFSVTVNNTNGLALTYEWYINATIQPGCVATTCTFLGSYSTDGIYNITNIVISSANTIRNQWNLTVFNATPPTPPVVTPTTAKEACANVAAGYQGLADYFKLFILAVTGVFVAAAAWKIYEKDYSIDFEFLTKLALVAVVAGLTIALGSAILSPVISTCV